MPLSTATCPAWQAWSRRSVCLKAHKNANDVLRTWLWQEPPQEVQEPELLTLWYVSLWLSSAPFPPTVPISLKEKSLGNAAQFTLHRGLRAPRAGSAALPECTFWSCSEWLVALLILKPVQHWCWLDRSTIGTQSRAHKGWVQEESLQLSFHMRSISTLGSWSSLSHVLPALLPPAPISSQLDDCSSTAQEHPGSPEGFLFSGWLLVTGTPALKPL